MYVRYAKAFIGAEGAGGAYYRAPGFPFHTFSGFQGLQGLQRLGARRDKCGGIFCTEDTEREARQGECVGGDFA